MWIETKQRELINTDWVSWIEIYADASTNPRKYELKVNFAQGDVNWVIFGRYETAKEALLEFEKIKSKLISEQ